jgi:hypothetical protein
MVSSAGEAKAKAEWDGIAAFATLGVLEDDEATLKGSIKNGPGSSSEGSRGSEPSRDCGSCGAERGASLDPSESSACAILEECSAGHGDVAEALDVCS